MHKILNLLPTSNDHAEAALLDSNEYEIHFLYPLEDVIDTGNYASLSFASYLGKPEFLISYVERAVRYVKDHEITAIMFSHDMASMVASVVCEQTGLPGPTLESNFLCLHKYYSRKTENGKLWFDYINMDKPSSEWKDKMRYPCILKAPFLESCYGICRVTDNAEMEAAVAKLNELVAPYFTGYRNFFKRYLDLEKFPLAVENIAVVEELVDMIDQYCFDGWCDNNGIFRAFTLGSCELSPGRAGGLLHSIYPQFISGAADGETYKKLYDYTVKMVQRFGLTNTFINIEFWHRGDEITLIEVNGRIAHAFSAAHRKMWNISGHHAAVFLACGETEKLAKCKTSACYKDGEPISGQFFVSTSGEGKGKDFLDYARRGCISDGAYITSGPGMLISVNEETPVRQTSTAGRVRLCNFFLTEASPSSLFQRANEVKTKLLLREDRDLLKLPGNECKHLMKKL